MFYVFRWCFENYLQHVLLSKIYLVLLHLGLLLHHSILFLKHLGKSFRSCLTKGLYYRKLSSNFRRLRSYWSLRRCYITSVSRSWRLTLKILVLSILRNPLWSSSIWKLRMINKWRFTCEASSTRFIECIFIRSWRFISLLKYGIIFVCIFFWRYKRMLIFLL